MLVSDVEIVAFHLPVCHAVALLQYPMPSEQDKAKWWQFSLRTLMILVSITCVVALLIKSWLPALTFLLDYWFEIRGAFVMAMLIAIAAGVAAWIFRFFKRD